MVRGALDGEVRRRLAGAGQLYPWERPRPRERQERNRGRSREDDFRSLHDRKIPVIFRPVSFRRGPHLAADPRVSRLESPHGQRRPIGADSRLELRLQRIQNRTQAMKDGER